VLDGLFDRWSDIMGFSRNRKLFGIDTALSVKPFQFQLVSFCLFAVNFGPRRLVHVMKLTCVSKMSANCYRFIPCVFINENLHLT